MRFSRKFWIPVAALLIFALLASGCTQRFTYKQVSLKPSARETPGTASASESAALRVAVAAILSPQTTTHGYDRLVAYLTSQLNRPVRLVQRATYAETNELVRTRQVDLAFVCTGAYIQGHKQFGLELLAVPQIAGQTTYRSYIIVPANSPAQTVDDLRGHVFAFTDPLSLSGYLVPLHMLATENKGTSDTYFSRTLFTYGHENSIKAVAEGWVDGAAVDSLVYDATVAEKPDYGRKTRVIWASVPYGAPPVVVHPALDAATKDALRRLLLHMHETEEGRSALAPLGVDRFVPADDRLYDSARAVIDTLGGTP